ncbi:MAG: prepilin-type N-terminal cleavage/methylation domain-containing protein [Nitrospinae bacterium]|nr:prepilin-type N-terminal cleavage/methylation domain-containing protein [Nitrospinota bacterium]
MRFKWLEKRGRKAGLRDGGFTLVEMMVVVFIASLFAALVAPRLTEVGELRINRSATHISNTITYLYSQAAAHHVVVRLNFDLKTGKYYPATLNKKGEFEATTFPLFSFGTIGDGISIKKFVTLFGGEKAGDTAYIHFLPEGFAEKSVIVLRDNSGRELSLVVDPLMGRVTTSKGEVSIDMPGEKA